jgi:hypothetical protein
MSNTTSINPGDHFAGFLSQLTESGREIVAEAGAEFHAA